MEGMTMDSEDEDEEKIEVVEDKISKVYTTLQIYSM